MAKLANVLICETDAFAINQALVGGAHHSFDRVVEENKIHVGRPFTRSSSRQNDGATRPRFRVILPGILKHRDQIDLLNGKILRLVATDNTTEESLVKPAIREIWLKAETVTTANNAKSLTYIASHLAKNNIPAIEVAVETASILYGNMPVTFIEALRIKDPKPHRGKPFRKITLETPKS